jgi:peptide/nickel transport system permease protein
MKRLRQFAWTLLALAYLVALAPDFFCPYPAAEQHRDYPYAAPGRYGEGRLVLLARGEPYRLLGVIPASLRLVGVRGSGGVFLLGADEFGRDVYSRLCHGASTSLLLAPAAVLFSLALALALGGLAGYAGGWTDAVIMRGGEIFLSLPWFYFVVALRAALPLNLSLRAQEFVLASRALGAGPLRIFTRHILPALLPAARAQLLLTLPAYIITEVSLSFLGLGVVEPTPTWGNLLTPLQQYVVLTAYPWMLAPAFAVIGVFLALHTVAEGAAEPRRYL